MTADAQRVATAATVNSRIADLEEELAAVDVGLLNGKGVTADQLEATAHRLVVDAIEPIAAVATA